MRALYLSLTLLAMALPVTGRAEAQLLRRRERGSDARETLRFRGGDRTYIARIPERVRRARRPVPLVLVFHGGGGNADNAERMTGFTRKAEAEGFIVVYPDGSARGRVPLRTWNAGHCCGYALREQIDDVGFVSALIDALQAKYPIDPKRIYATGMSNGAMMSHRLGIELSHRIAAIAPVVGALFGDERVPAVGVSALIVNGRADAMIPYGGGPPPGRFADAWDGHSMLPAAEQATFWASANGCAPTPHRTETTSLAIVEYECPSPLRVAFYTLEDGGHAWPGGTRGSRRGAEPSAALKATDVIWDFFAAHPKR